MNFLARQLLVVLLICGVLIVSVLPHADASLRLWSVFAGLGIISGMAGIANLILGLSSRGRDLPKTVGVQLILLVAWGTITALLFFISRNSLLNRLAEVALYLWTYSFASWTTRILTALLGRHV